MCDSYAVCRKLVLIIIKSDTVIRFYKSKLIVLYKVYYFIIGFKTPATKDVKYRSTPVRMDMRILTVNTACAYKYQI